MNITELNKQLKITLSGMSSISSAKIKGKDTLFYDDFDNEVAKLDEDNDFTTGVGEYVSVDYFDIITKYANTPLIERLKESEDKYNLILFKDFYENSENDDTPYLTAIKKDKCDKTSIYSNDNVDKGMLKSSEFQFTKSEIKKIIEKRPLFKDIILSSMKEVKD